MYKSVLFFFTFLLFNLTHSQVRINEFMSDNSSFRKNEKSAFTDWIEIYNHGDKPVNLEGYMLQISTSNGKKWKFPNVVLKPKRFLVVYASGLNLKKDKKNLHANFQINRNGERISLLDPSRQILDQINVVPLAKNFAFAREIDGLGSFKRTMKASPGQSNSASFDLVFSSPSGFYKDSLLLEINSEKRGEIRYTLNGDIPTQSSTLYLGPITLKDLKSDSTDIGYIDASTTNNKIKSPYQKASVISAAVFQKGEMISEVVQQVYFITPKGKNRYKGIRVISIVSPTDGLFDFNKGIYLKGEHFEKNSKSGNYFQRSKSWERKANITYFDSDGEFGFSQDIGIRIHGGLGRRLPQKSFRLYARKEFGAHCFQYPFFHGQENTMFHRLVLRNSFGCWEKTIIKDEVISDLSKELNIDVMDGEAVVVFLNGNYWGLYSLREYFDEHYLSTHHKVNKDSVNIVLHGYGNYDTAQIDWGLIKGNGNTMSDLYTFLNQNSLANQTNYDHVKSILDMKSIVDYYCVQIFINNKDWPTNNNKLWSVGSGKWRQVLFDVDAGCKMVKTNTIEYLRKIGGRKQNSPYATFLFRKLIESEVFRHELARGMEHLINDVFTLPNLNRVIEKIGGKYENQIDEHAARWSSAENKAAWLNRVNALRVFFGNRPFYIVEMFKQEFKIQLYYRYMNTRPQ